MAAWLRLTLVVPLGLVSACSILGLDMSRNAWVAVDPTVIQRVRYTDTDQEVTTREVRDHDEIECLQETPRRCRVSEFVRATIHNHGDETIRYISRCGGPLQHRRGGDWTFVLREVFCILVGIPPVEIEAGGHHGVEVHLPAEASDTYRIVFTLYDDDGELPLAMRASESFEVPADRE